MLSEWVDDGVELFRVEQSRLEYTKHYHHERNHQGLKNQLIEKASDAPSTQGAVECRERLGGVLKYYYREAA